MALHTVNVKCDRCGKKVKGQEDFNYTCGFYSVENTAWSAFAYQGEKVICDRCMWNSELYKKIYGDMNSKNPPKD